MPNYMFAILHPTGQLPVLDEKFDFRTTDEHKWSYGNIASTTKILTASRMGVPIPMLQWQLKRYNNRLASFSSNAEGSIRLLCDMCNKFQVMDPRPNHHLGAQGCSMCIHKLPFIDTTLLVRLIYLKILKIHYSI